MEEFALAVSKDKFVAEEDLIVSTLAYVMFRSDYQNDYMKNGVLSQFNWGSKVALSDPLIPVFVWRYSDLKSQKMESADKAYLAALLNDPQIKVYHGDDVNGWLDGFAQDLPEEQEPEPCPVVIGEYDDKNMQNSNPLEFVMMCLPSVATAKQDIIIENWLNLANLADTPENRQKVIDSLITDEYVLKSNGNPVYVIHKNIKILPNATLEARDTFRTEVDEPAKSTIGFMRKGQEKDIMDYYGIAKKSEYGSSSSSSSSGE